MPWRQCTATFFPSSSATAMLAISETAAGTEAGTPRSGIGNEIKRMPFSAAARGSSTKSSWSASSFSSRETTRFNTSSTPAVYFILKPVPSPWPRGDGQPAAPRTRYPEQVRDHDVSRLSRKLIEKRSIWPGSSFIGLMTPSEYRNRSFGRGEESIRFYRL